MGTRPVVVANPENPAKHDDHSTTTTTTILDKALHNGRLNTHSVNVIVHHSTHRQQIPDDDDFAVTNNNNDNGNAPANSIRRNEGHRIDVDDDDDNRTMSIHRKRLIVGLASSSGATCLSIGFAALLISHAVAIIVGLIL